LISQVVPQLGVVKHGEMAKQASIHTRLSRAYLALARLSCYRLALTSRCDQVAVEPVAVAGDAWKKHVCVVLETCACMLSLPSN